MTKEQRRAAQMEKKTQQSQETQELRSKLQIWLEARIDEKVDERVAHRVNELMPTVMSSVLQYLINGATGPLPMISLGASNSHTRAPPNQNAPVLLVTPPARNVGAREDSPSQPASSPSVTHTPAPGPSTLAEHDALRVIISVS